MFDPSKSAKYWGSNRFEATDEQQAALSPGTPPELNEAFARWEYQLLLRFATDPVLDVGCGWGRTMEDMRRAFLTSVGVDFSLGMLARGRIGPLVNGDATQLPFIDRSFGTALSSVVLMFMPEEMRWRSVQEMCRVSDHLVLVIIGNGAAKHLRTGEDNPFRLGRQLENGYFSELVSPYEIVGYIAACGFIPTIVAVDPLYTTIRRYAKRRHRISHGIAEEDLSTIVTEETLAMSDHVAIIGVRQ